MNRLLAQLAARSLGAKEPGVPILRPRLPSLYEPAPDDGPAAAGPLSLEIDAEAPETGRRTAPPLNPPRPDLAPPMEPDQGLSAVVAGKQRAAPAPARANAAAPREKAEEIFSSAPRVRIGPEPPPVAPPAAVRPPARPTPETPPPGASRPTEARETPHAPHSSRDAAPAQAPVAVEMRQAAPAPVPVPPPRAPSAIPAVAARIVDRAAGPPPPAVAAPREKWPPEPRGAPRPEAQQRVQVTIGRIEIRAAAAAQPPPAPPPRPKPAMSLDDYLARRERS